MTSLAEELEEQGRWRLRPQCAGLDWFDRLLEGEFLDPEESQARANGALSRMVAFAARSVPYYRDLFARLDLRPEQIASTRDLPRLPVLTRFDLQENLAALQPAHLPPGDRLWGHARSSGTTGVPTTVMMSARSIAFFGALKQREFRWFRFDPMRTFAAIRKSSDLPLKPSGEPIGEGETATAPAWPYVGAVFETGPFVGFSQLSSLSSKADWLLQHRPAYQLSRAGNLEHLAFEFQERPRPDFLRGLQSISEHLTPSMRARMEGVLGAPVHQNYGLNEIGICAGRCPEGGRFHVHAEFCHVEIVDDAGRPCPPGGRGRLLVTGLRNPAMPLLRYDTGDLAEASEGPCPCGRTLPAFGAILGRSRRFALCPPGTLHRVEAIDSAIDHLPPVLLCLVRQYQLHQFKDESFELRVVATKPLPEAFFSLMREAWDNAGAARAAILNVREVEESTFRGEHKFQKFTSDFVSAPVAKGEDG
jgi:phenylacetate-CoA ligase